MKPPYDTAPREPDTLRTTYKVPGGERIPPVHKPARRKQCVWVTGIGWVLNPTRRQFD